MYCDKCGAQIPDNAKFCRVCGTALPDEDSFATSDAEIKTEKGTQVSDASASLEAPEPRKVAERRRANGARCPRCGSHAFPVVQKVSAAYTARTGPTDRLAPPGTLPEKPYAGYGCFGWIGHFMLANILSNIVRYAVLLLLDYLEVSVLGRAASGIPLAFGVVAGIAVWITIMVSGRRVEQRRIAESMESYQEDQFARLAGPFARWNRLYYCHTDDLVWDPDTGESCESVWMHKTFLKSS